MERRRQVAISKRLAYHLRHDPAGAGIELDPAGWADLHELARGVEGVDEAEILEVVTASRKRRFQLSRDGGRIRARYGHTVAVDADHEPAVPPPLLYHGTAARNVDAILREGLDPRGRRHVHLSASVAEAEAVGRRHGRPVVLVVDAAGLHAEGIPFVRATDGVWLVDHVPPRYLATR